MNTYKQTVTIGLPVYNEEKNILKILHALLNQKLSNFSLDRIVIASDGSTDDTHKLVKSLRSKKIMLLTDGKRKGKPARINEIFEMATSDIVVILDADITIHSKFLIETLVTPFLNPTVALTSGKSMFLPSINPIQKIITTGIVIWNDIKQHAKNAEMYLCEGQIRAFSKSIYKTLRFPNASADDVYPYLYCKQKGYNFVFVPEAKIYYKLPSTLKDYILQHTRFLQSQSIQEDYFDKTFVKQYYTIGMIDKIKALGKYIVIRPWWTILYLFLLLVPKIAIHFDIIGKTALWQIARSTK